MIGKKIIITGDKVKGIGYRPFLLEKAIRLKIKNFDAINVESEDEIDNEKQVLIVCTSGEDKQITDFVEFVQSKKGKPRKAKVDSVVSSDIYTEDVISISEYRTILSAEQQSKTVQGGLLIVDKLDVGFDKMNKNIELLRTETNDNFDKMDKKFGLFEKKMDVMIGKQEEMIGEIKGLRNDFQSYFDQRFEKLEKDVFLIKEKMHIVA